jgi:uncharacterized protein (UPF0216 family)
MFKSLIFVVRKKKLKSIKKVLEKELKVFQEEIVLYYLRNIKRT